MKMSNWKWILVALALAAAIPTTALAQSEGIKVHGHWVIEVRNPDGSLVDRREVQNALSVAGGPLLAGLLTRNLSAGYWTILLTGGSNSACAPAPGTACWIQQSRPAGQPGVFPPGPASQTR